MVIGVVGPIVVLASTKLFVSVVLIEVFVGEDALTIDEVIVIARMIAINKLFATTIPTITVKHPSKHNIY